MTGLPGQQFAQLAHILGRAGIIEPQPRQRAPRTTFGGLLQQTLQILVNHRNFLCVYCPKMGYAAQMGRWIFMTLCILLLVAGGYWLLQHEGIQSCNQLGGDWDYARWKCNSG
jgi:hypothetical protein